MSCKFGVPETSACTSHSLKCSTTVCWPPVNFQNSKSKPPDQNVFCLQTLVFRNLMSLQWRHGSWACPFRRKQRKAMQRLASRLSSCPTPCASLAMRCRFWPHLRGLCEFLSLHSQSSAFSHPSALPCAAQFCSSNMQQRFQQYHYSVLK